MVVGGRLDLALSAFQPRSVSSRGLVPPRLQYCAIDARSRRKEKPSFRIPFRCSRLAALPGSRRLPARRKQITLLVIRRSAHDDLSHVAPRRAVRARTAPSLQRMRIPHLLRSPPPTSPASRGPPDQANLAFKRGGIASSPASCPAAGRQDWRSKVVPPSGGALVLTVAAASIGSAPARLTHRRRSAELRPASPPRGRVTGPTALPAAATDKGQPVDLLLTGSCGTNHRRACLPASSSTASTPSCDRRTPRHWARPWRSTRPTRSRAPSGRRGCCGWGRRARRVTV